MDLITTDRLVLRRPRRADVFDIVHMANHFEVAKWVTRVPHPYTVTDAESFLTHVEDTPNPIWIIADAQSPVGMIGLDPALGYWLNPQSWGKGYASEAGRAVLSWHFARSGDDVAAHYIQGNAASARVLSKLGFREIGVSTCSSLAGGADLPSIQLLLTQADWVKVDEVS